jgi:hypothetical protein
VDVRATMSDVYTIDQETIEAALRITFAEVAGLAKAKGINLKEHFRNIVPADVLERVTMPKYAKNIMPYWPIIAWYQGATTHPCRCGCMMPLQEGRFATPTCRVRYEIMRDCGKAPGPCRRRKMPRRKCA